MNPVVINWLQGFSTGEGEREGKDDIQDSGLDNMGIRTAALCQETQEKFRSQKEDPVFGFEYAEFKVLVRPVRGDVQQVIMFADLKFKAES